jgi:carboxylesterase
MRPWAEHHDAEGWDVAVPLLPGHGTTWQDMSRSTAEQWYGEVRGAARELIDRHGSITVGGLSMGGALTLALAEDSDLAPTIDAIMLVNALSKPEPRWLVAPLLAPLVGSVPAIGGDVKRDGVREETYDRTPLRSVRELRRLASRVRRDLGRVTAPALVACSDIIAAGVAGPVERLPLPNSFHVATIDNDAPELFAAASDFLNRRVPV